MVLIIVVRLHTSALERYPSLIRASVLPLDLVHNVGWHAQDTSSANVAMVVCLHHSVLADHGVFDDECGLIGQSQISLGVKRVHDVGTASILEGLGFLPIHQFVVFGAVMSVVL